MYGGVVRIEVGRGQIPGKDVLGRKSRRFVLHAMHWWPISGTLQPIVAEVMLSSIRGMTVYYGNSTGRYLHGGHIFPTSYHREGKP